jgi:hypothetical protein
LFVGDSGLGKTPLLVMCGMAVAAGVDFLGHRVTPGPVIYGDAEMGIQAFANLQAALARHLGIPEPPKDFLPYSLNWGPADSLDAKSQLKKQIAAVRPSLVIVDPLRSFFPGVNAKGRDAEELTRWQRDVAKTYGCSWINLHHRRKPNSQALESPSLLDDPRPWFNESAGSNSLVNLSDLRLGIEAGTGEADVVLGGFARFTGVLAPIRLGREYDGNGDPVGYRVLTGVNLLSVEQQSAFGALPAQFTFTQAKTALTTKSDSKTDNFLKACVSAGLIRKEENGGKKFYLKIH